MNYKDIREECCEANIALPRTGLVDLTFGNVSVLDAAAGVFAIKPSGVDYAALKPEDMVIVDLEGQTVAGELRFSSDTPTHRCLFLAFAEHGVRSIVHTHSRKAVAFAQAAIEIPCLGTTHCDYFNGPVPVTRDMTAAEVQGAYEWETGNVIVERFAELNPMEIAAVLVRNHGPFAWGVSGAKAVETAQALEIVADMALHSLSLNPTVCPAPNYLREKHFFRKHGAGAYYGQK
ncbi:L-ribulose-5-phosphate 4-epimerase AraD [Coraliomargarita algicola]|uniref:L-ribulose-5-phosphate 4-epimerase n=2 Tax=Coraliomargaritaceae TaxID=3056371 RepID=A0ABU1ALY5_9BACT|nr:MULTISPECIES: L-ribulose-5-phosphate 4-epimerase AraD [unclassified Coraliomargarita]MDQ8195815.1 L-ribulose-5-phosphate 4-epimerase AraD [Coraliomargarita sp. SDUM461004]WPJ95921.1 L-ribulose-5-phosphate 4-epimerase AraD [Coraliomargarita sp. J2-16]